MGSNCLIEFKQYINSLDKHNIKLYQIKKELIIYIATETIKDILSNDKNSKQVNFDVLYVYEDLQTLEIEDIIEMSKKEDLDKCAGRYLKLL
jgi:hypothetical protein